MGSWTPAPEAEKLCLTRRGGDILQQLTSEQERHCHQPIPPLHLTNRNKSHSLFSL